MLTLKAISEDVAQNQQKANRGKNKETEDDEEDFF
jgi:hypothetical protein